MQILKAVTWRSHCFLTEATPVAEKGGEGVAATPAAPKAEAGGGAGGGDGGVGEEGGGGGGGGGAGGGGSEVKAAERHVEKVAAPSLPSAARPVSAAHQTQCCGKLKVLRATGKVSRICQLKVCISNRKSVANLSAQGMYQQQEKCRESVSSRYVSATGKVSRISSRYGK
jgi:hypothetical protein